MAGALCPGHFFCAKISACRFTYILGQKCGGVDYNVGWFCKSDWEIRPFGKRGGLRFGEFPSRFLRNEGNSGSRVVTHSIHITFCAACGSLRSKFFFACLKAGKEVHLRVSVVSCSGAMELPNGMFVRARRRKMQLTGGSCVYSGEYRRWR